MKALVLEGCTGLLGQALRHVLLGRGWSVESLERSDGDILDADFLQARLDSCAPDVVFSSLGWNTVDDAEDHPDEVLLYNRTLPHTLACLLKTRGEGHLVHFSSGLVFSGQHGSPWREEDATAPLNVYGKTRLAGEQAVLQTLPERACVVRTGWLFGPGKRNFVDDILNACHRRDSITIVDDRTGSPTYSLDLALWSIMLAERQATGLWHAVNSGQATWCELACEAVGLAGNECAWSPSLRRNGRKKRRVRPIRYWTAASFPSIWGCIRAPGHRPCGSIFSATRSMPKGYPARGAVVHRHVPGHGGAEKSSGRETLLRAVDGSGA